MAGRLHGRLILFVVQSHRSCVNVEVSAQGSPSLRVHKMVCVDVQPN